MNITLEYLLNVQKLPVKGIYIELTANERELKNLAVNHELLEVNLLKVSYKATPGKASSVTLSGILEAKIIQSCVATNKPIEKTINKNVQITYIKAGSKLAIETEYKLSNELYTNDEDESHFFELYEKNTIDIGAITEEIFELSIDLYPRIDNKNLIVFSSDNIVVDEKQSPFAILKKLK